MDLKILITLILLDQIVGFKNVFNQRHFYHLISIRGTVKNLRVSSLAMALQIDKPTESSSSQPPKIWSFLSNGFKDQARNWFVQRAERLGIPWIQSTADNTMKLDKLVELKDELIDKDIIYPQYYTLPFHGYDEGNLNWLAACEMQAATLSIAGHYWKNTPATQSQDWLRFNVTNNIKQYIKKYSKIKEPSCILDVGCSVGISTEFLYSAFTKVKQMDGIDLSPYFVAMATLRASEEEFNLPIEYHHKNAEYTGFNDNTYDLIVSSFLFHELNEEATINILKEIHRILQVGGTIAIHDLSPKKLKGDNAFINTFRRWAFEVTEPHIYGYYERDMNALLKAAGFKSVKEKKNDPINSIWFGTKR